VRRGLDHDGRAARAHTATSNSGSTVPAPMPACRASASNRRAIAASPPAVFSTRIGAAKPPSSACLTRNRRQLSTPTAGSSPRATCPPCTTSPNAPTCAAAAACCVTIFRDGTRTRLLVDARLTGYGACTTTATSAARSCAARGCGAGAFNLRVAEEHLQHLGTAGRGRAQRVVVLANVGSDEDTTDAADAAHPARVATVADISGARGPAFPGAEHAGIGEPEPSRNIRAGSIAASPRTGAPLQPVQSLRSSRPSGFCRGAVRTSCRGWTATVPVHRR